MGSLKEPMPQFDRLATEYGEWYQDMLKGKGNTLDFQSWIVRHRTLANELFEDLRRVALAKGWSADRFLHDANQLMALEGHYFGTFGRGPNYEVLLRASDIKTVPAPWAAQMSAPPCEEAEEGSAWCSSSPRHGGRAVAAAPALIRNSCEHCGEDAGDGAWGRGLAVVLDGTPTRPARLCRAAGCAAVLDWRAVKQHRREGERGFRCPACRHTLCVRCGAQQPLAVVRYARRACHALAASVAPTRGLAPFRRAAHRQGFRERTLEDVHTPVSVPELRRAGLLGDADADSDADSDDDVLLPTGPADGAPRRKTRAAGAPLDESEYGLAHVLRNKRERQAARGGLARRLDFGAVHQEEPTDAWFAQRNRDVYAATAAFAERWFGDVDFPGDFEGAAWLEDYGVQFVEYAGRVACEDRLAGPWDAMMKDRAHRKWLVMAVLASIMHRKIFCELLFGATRDQAAELDRQDAMFVDADGYQRSRLRSEMINMYLQGRMLSDDFWRAVDGLTSAAAAVLLPLANALCCFRRPEGRTDARELWGELHGVLAEAGYLAVCMARSPAVFHVLPATPGARMDWALERPAEHALYAAARDARARAALDRALADASASPADAAAVERRYRLDRHHHTAGAKVKYAVWPRITLYRQENVGAPGEGQRIVTVGHGVVVYYQGLLYPRASADDAPGGLADGVTLAAHRAAERRALERRWRERWRAPRFVVMLALTAAAFRHARPFLAFVRHAAPPPARVAAALAARRAHAFLGLAAAVVLALLLQRRRRDYLLGHGALVCLAVAALYAAVARSLFHRPDRPYALAALAFATAVALLHGRARPYVLGLHAMALKVSLCVATAVWFLSLFLR